MSLPLLKPRARAPLGAMALVSVLHTSGAAFAQTHVSAPPGAVQAPVTTPATPANTPPANAPAGNPPAGSPSADDAANVRERARAAYNAGQSAYGAGQFAAAEAHFALADSLLPAVQAKFWRAMSLDQLSDVSGALAAFEKVLASQDRAQLGPEKLATAEARQKALAAMPAELTITTTPPGAHVNVSGVDLRAPTPLTLRLAPGRHVVRISLDGYESQQVELNVSAGAKLSPSVVLVPLAKTSGATLPTPVSGLAPVPALSPPPTDPSLPAAPRSRIPGYVTLGIAGASAVVGTIFGIRALSDKQDFEDDPTTKTADDVERNALIADMAFGVTLTLGITGIVLLVADDPVPDQPQVGSLSRDRVLLAPYVSRTGAGAAAKLTF